MLTYTFTNANPSQDVIDAQKRGECNFVVVNRHIDKVYVNEIDPNIGVGESIPDTTSISDILKLNKELKSLNQTSNDLKTKIDQIQGTSDSGTPITIVKEMVQNQQITQIALLKLNEKIEALSKVILSLH